MFNVDLLHHTSSNHLTRIGKRNVLVYQKTWSPLLHSLYVLSSKKKKLSQT